MHLSTLAALAGLVMTGVQAACPPRHRPSHGGQRPSAIPSYLPSVPPVPLPSPIIPSYVPAPLPTTLSSVVIVTTPAPVTTAAPETTPSPSPSPPASTPTPNSADPAPAAVSAPPAGDASLATDESNALAAQNAARAVVGVPALTWDAQLVSDAQAWADHLAAQGTPGTLVHDEQNTEGENLYWTSGSSDPYAEAAAAWVGEKSLYNGEAITGVGNFEEYGHYTQIIWRTTTHVGMATADDGQGGVYVVARYSPPGNMIGETPTTA
ncbi:unnamed protein product [Discula destructiva]